MGFGKMKEMKRQMGDYMINEITKIIKTFDKREPGSAGERDAVEYMAETVKPYVDELKIEDFPVYPASFMGWIYITVTLVLLGFATYFIMPIVTLVLIAIGMTFMFGQFIFYRRMIDKLFRERTSCNLTAIKKPTGEVKRRILFNGHPDAAYEWTFNYHFGGVGFISHFVVSVLGVVVLFVLSAISIFAPNGSGIIGTPHGTMLTLGLISLVFVPFLVGMYWLWNEKLVVDGANDNLTGCYMGICVLKAMHDAGVSLENTEVGIVLTGSEEAGLRGAKAWCEAHKDEYHDVETLIFAYDTIHEGKWLGVNVKDLNNTVKSDEHASRLFKEAADELGIPCGIIGVPLGATDSAAFSQGGFQATGITAMNHNLQDYYHTRKDTYDNMDVEGLADCFEVSVQVLQNFDAGK